MKQLWNLHGDFQIIGLGKDFFTVRFNMEEDFHEVIQEAPWFINHQFLLVRLRQPHFYIKEAQTDVTVVWIRLPELLVEYYDLKVLKQIGELLGTVLRIDTRTAQPVGGGMQDSAFKCKPTNPYNQALG